ncbi:glucokinase [Sandarakinorhabdus sp.]|uniref:glucokinase n=1 Tax=Sandarakinorhabdus sp. TaxID=1916663 RepID=UPI0033412D8A
MTELVAADIGGTHARFALARIDAGQVALEEPVVLRCADHASLAEAWATFGRMIARPLPRAAAIAVACPVAGDTLKLTNNPWVIRPAVLGIELGLDSYILINDFEAVAHAVGACGPDQFQHVCGPDVPLPGSGVISVIGPGTGLGVAMLLRDGGKVLASEGSHGDFAPVDAIDDAILAHLRRQFGRVSTERVVSGPGLAAIYAAMAAEAAPPDDTALWQQALSGTAAPAVAALTRFCMALGSFAGNMALAHGAGGVVIAGGLGARLAGVLPQSAFAERFVAKGRFLPMLQGLPVKLIRHAQPGLLGAVTAFARHRNMP